MYIYRTISEISMMAAIKSTSILSKFLQRPIGLIARSTEINGFEALEFFTDSTEAIASSILPTKGDLSGVSFLIHSHQSALRICDLLLNRGSCQTQVLGRVEIAALTGIAKICVREFLAYFSQVLQLQLLASDLIIFENGASRYMQEKIVSLFPDDYSQKLIIKSCIEFQINHIRSNLTILLDYSALDMAFKKLPGSPATNIFQYTN